MRRVFLILALMTSVQTSAAAETNGNLDLQITGGTPNVGQMVITIFNSKETYMKTPFVEHVISVNSEGQALLTMVTLQQGEYAVSVFYDKNSDGKLNTGFLGIPKEKIGFSNNAKSRMGPAPFSKTSFSLTKKKLSMKIYVGRAK